MNIVEYNVSISGDPVGGHVWARNAEEAARSVTHLATFDDVIEVITRAGTMRKYRRFGALGVQRVMEAA